jgi:hypothetical protein
VAEHRPVTFTGNVVTTQDQITFKWELVSRYISPLGFLHIHSLISLAFCLSRCFNSRKYVDIGDQLGQVLCNNLASTTFFVKAGHFEIVLSIYIHQSIWSLTFFSWEVEALVATRSPTKGDNRFPRITVSQGIIPQARFSQYMLALL